MVSTARVLTDSSSPVVRVCAQIVMYYMQSVMHEEGAIKFEDCYYMPTFLDSKGRINI